jgi:CRP/FNR family transcriptional regulator, nitrogen oxide reductase regulator
MKTRRKTPLEINKVDAESCSFDLRLKIIHKLPFFKHLSHDTIKEINSLFNDIQYSADDTIYFSGDVATRLCVIASGSVKLIKQNKSGSNTLVDILRQGEFFGNLDPFGNTLYQETTIVQTSSCIMKIDTKDFRSILTKHPSVSLLILDIMSNRLREAQEQIRQLSTIPVEGRIAYTLFKLSQKLGEQKDIGLLIQIPLSREDIAGMTGTTPETASRIISQLQKENIIQTGRKWVAIKNINKLKKLAFLE